MPGKLRIRVEIRRDIIMIDENPTRKFKLFSLNSNRELAEEIAEIIGVELGEMYGKAI